MKTNNILQIFIIYSLRQNYVKKRLNPVEYRCKQIATKISMQYELEFPFVRQHRRKQSTNQSPSKYIEQIKLLTTRQEAKGCLSWYKKFIQIGNLIHIILFPAK